jgi:NTE family protein
MRLKVWLGNFLISLLLFANSPAKTIRLQFYASNSPLEQYGGRRVITQPRIGLALSGGGARGFAHIGVLKVLERENIPISAIAGTSMGGAIGGLYSAGYSAQELERLALEINWQDIFSNTPSRLSLLQSQREEAEGALFQLRFDGLKPQIPSGLTLAQKLTNLLSDLTFQADYQSGGNFNQLKIPYRSVTTDLVSGSKVVLDSGELGIAIRATIAVPLAITPVSYNGKLLVDGGLIDPIPVEVVKQMGADKVIAVNTSAALLPKEKITDPLDIASQSVSIMSLQQEHQSLQMADLVLKPALPGFSSTDFDQAESLMVLGEKAADSLLPQIKQLIEQDSSKNYYIDRIEIIGNRIISADSLRGWAGLRVPARISERDIYRILTNLYNRGLLREIYAEIDTGTEPGTLTVIIEENPPVKEVVIHGNPKNPQKTKVLAPNDPHGDIFDYPRLNELVGKELDRIKEKGASLAKIASIEYDSTSQRLVIGIDYGRISQINLEGNRKTKDWLIYSNFPLRPGGIFNLKTAQKGIANLQASGYFDQVSLRAANSPAGAVLHLALNENKFTVLKGGLHWREEYHLEGFLESGYLNLFGAGNQIFLRSLYGERKEDHSIRLKANRIFMTYLTYQLSFYYRNQENFLYGQSKRIGEFEEIRRGMSFSLGHNLAKLGKVSAEFLAERINVHNSTSNTSEGVNKRSLWFKLLFDNLDRYPYPTSGNYNLLTLEIASRVLEGDVSYRKLSSSLETYLPLSEKLNLHPRLQTGYADRKLLLYEQFCLGGKESFFGFNIAEKRGNKLAQFSLELRLQTARRIFWFIRYDLGDTWGDEVELKNVKHALGLKLGIATPLGPLELGYGYNSLKQDKLYLTWGHYF